MQFACKKNFVLKKNKKTRDIGYRRRPEEKVIRAETEAITEDKKTCKTGSMWTPSCPFTPVSIHSANLAKLHSAGAKGFGSKQVKQGSARKVLTFIKKANKFCCAYSIVKGIQYKRYLFKSNISLKIILTLCPLNIFFFSQTCEENQETCFVHVIP